MLRRRLALLLFLFLALPGIAHAWVRQDTSVNQSGGGSTSIAVTMGRAPLNGELLVAIVSWDSGGYTPGAVTFTDNGTGTANTWVKAWETTSADNQYSALFWTVNARTSSTITVATAQFGAAVTFRGVVIRTYTGNAAQGSQPSGTAQSTGSSHTTATDNLNAGSTTTPNQSAALVVAGGYCGGTSTITAGTGFGNATSAGGAFCQYLEDQIQTTATATNGPATASGSGNHSWGVVAFNSITDTEAPTDPTSLNATANGATQIDLTWTASTDNIAVVRYRVERCTGSGCSSFSEISQPTTNSYSNQGLSSSTLYRYRVRAEDGAGNLSGYSNTAEATTGVAGDTESPTQPSSAAAVAPGTHGIDIGWGASSDNVGVTAYRIERCAGASCSSFSEIAQTTALTYADRGLTPDTLYRYRVRAQDAAVNFSTYSTTVEARTRTRSPTLSWTDNSDNETGFIISRRTGCNSSASFSDVATVDAGTTTWSDTTTQTVEMEYRVRATNSGGDSANTSTVCWTKEKTIGVAFTGRPATARGLRLRFPSVIPGQLGQGDSFDEGGFQ